MTQGFSRNPDCFHLRAILIDSGEIALRKIVEPGEHLIRMNESHTT